MVKRWEEMTEKERKQILDQIWIQNNADIDYELYVHKMEEPDWWEKVLGSP